MGLTDPERRALTGRGPSYGRITQAQAEFGLSRSGIYRLAAQGQIKLVKLNGATLVDFDSVRAFMATLPAAEISAPKSAA